MRTQLRVLVALFLLSLCGQAGAMNLYSYDLDSLAYMSSDVVEADIVGPKPNKGFEIVQVRVTQTYKGHFKKDQVIELTALSFFTKSGKEMFDTTPLVAGDHLFLWLAKAKETFLYNIPKDADIYWPVPSGVKLVQNARVLDFQQFNNPGPYQNVTPEQYSKGGPPTVDEFRAKLSESLRRTDELKTKFEAPATSADVPWLRELLRSSQRTGFFGRDKIAEIAATRLVKVATPTTLADALLKSQDYQITGILAGGLNTEPGRALLMKRIGDAQEPRADRLRYAGALNSFNLLLHPDATILSELAKLAMRVRSDETLTETILSSMGASSQISYGSPQSAREAAKKWSPALEQLRQLHGQTTLPKLRFQIETLTFNTDPEALQRFYPSLGPVPSIIHLPDDPAEYSKPAGRALTFEYEIRVLKANSNAWTPQLNCLTSITSGATFSPRHFRPIFR